MTPTSPAIRAFFLSLIVAGGLPALGAEPPARAGSPASLADLSLEELIDVRITSVAKKDQRLSEAAAAVFVISAEDIRRSGATHLADALRMVPGLAVGRMSSGSWAVSARGFNSRFATKLLVLVDGRTVYTPLFSGVFWDAQDTMIEDIERIEVIRGPGASLWGANAVNGVINVITKSAAATLGGLLSASAGNVEKGSLAARYGGELDTATRVRVYAKAGHRDPSAGIGEEAAPDSWNSARAGLRADRSAGIDTYTAQGEVYRSRLGDRLSFGTLLPPYSRLEYSPLQNTGAHVLGRWRRELSAQSDFSLQAYADHSRVENGGAIERRSTFDIEFQHGLRLGTVHDLNWGLGYRLTDDRFDARKPSAGDPLTSISLEPSRNRLNLASVFLQDDITLVPERLHAVAGARFEHNDFTGLEFQPNLRLSWTPDRSRTAWVALSRAVRSPSLIERESTVRTNVIPPDNNMNPGPLPILLDVRGSRDFASEVLVALEAGYRTRLSPALALDVTAYANRYRDLQITVPGLPAFVPSPVPHVEQRIDFANHDTARIYGAEVAIDWRPADRWRLQGAYTFTRVNFENRFGGSTLSRDADTPRHQGSLRSSLDLRTGVELDLWLRYAGPLVSAGVAIPRYTTLDARLAWHPSRSLELALAGQNLLDGRHPEFVSDFLGSVQTQVRRGAYASLRWKF